jgi:diaminopropionate ammonia-lyase
MPLDGLSAQFLPNPSLDRSRAYGVKERAVLSQERAEEAATAIRQWPGYAPTPLRRLPALAREAGIAEVRYKDEGHRFGLKSFKALGGAYAVQRLAAERDARELTVATGTTGARSPGAPGTQARRRLSSSMRA